MEFWKFTNVATYLYNPEVAEVHLLYYRKSNFYGKLSHSLLQYISYHIVLAGLSY